MSAPLTDVILFSTADWQTRYWTNKQHNAVALARRGHRVLYIETVGIRTAKLGNRRDMGRILRRLTTGLRGVVLGPTQVRQNIWTLSPLVFPWARRWSWLNDISAWLLRSSVHRFVRRHRFTPADVWTYHPYMLDQVSALKPRCLLYHCVDDLAAIPGVDADLFRRSEADLLKTADIVFVTARPLEKRARALNTNVVFLPNVADVEHFGAAFGAPLPADMEGIAHPTLGYHGVLSDNKIDVDLLIAVLDARPGWHLVLIGDEQAGQDSASFRRLRELTNAHFLGGRSYEVLPSYLAGFDVGLVPLKRNDYTASVFPMKYYEYLAAGVPVASTTLDYLADASGPVTSGHTLTEFIAAIEAQLRRGKLSRDEATEAVGENTWNKRLEKMLAAIDRLAI